MRILIATDSYRPALNGVAVFSDRLAVGLAGRGHDVAIVAPSPTGRPQLETRGRSPAVFWVRSIPTLHDPRQRAPLLSRRGAHSLLRAFRPDLLHIQNHFVLGRILAWAAGQWLIPVVGTNHFMPANVLPHAPRALRGWLGSRFMQRAMWRQLIRVYRPLAAVITPSQAAADVARANGLHRPIQVISNGVDLVRFHPDPRPGCSPEYDGRPAPPILLYVGRLDPEKGVETLLGALPAVLSRHTASLFLCGRGVQESALGCLAKTLRIAARVRFLGAVGDDQLPALYRAATVFVMPSPHELQSIATLEAMASGLPVIAARALALPELVEDGRNGLLFPPGDAGALADRLSSLLADPTWATDMGRKSREVAEGHNIEYSLHAFEALYRHLRASKAAGPPAGSSPEGATAGNACGPASREEAPRGAPNVS